MKKLRPYQCDTINALKTRLRETDSPLLVNASVGAGKSIIIAELLLVLEKAGWRALCLTLNSELIRQNAKTYQDQGGQASIYCASLGKKDVNSLIVFASPNSVIRGIKNRKDIDDVRFNLIVVDEAHNINNEQVDTMYMRILNHYAANAKFFDYKFRVVGLTGTPYRGKSVSIVGDEQFFKEQVCAISAGWLISQGYLAPPIFGYKDERSIDFSNLKVNSFGQFDNKKLNEVLEKNKRLTSRIMIEVVSIVEKENRNGAFIFASTRKHAIECLLALPPEQSAIITGDTPPKDRIKFLDDARLGIIKYLVNINVLTVGVDIPNFDTVVFVRPTESLILYTQAIGRGLRLYPGKKDALILDYAGNLERHGDVDEPIINEALKKRKLDDPDYCIPCYECKTFNKVTARRCIGTRILQEKESRCDHYFEFKNCPKCDAINDIICRHCRICGMELIDPNKKLKSLAASDGKIELKVEAAKYWLLNNRTPIFCAKYLAYDPVKNKKFIINESYSTTNQQTKNIFYGRMVKPQFKKPSEAYTHLDDNVYLGEIIRNGEITTPHSLLVKRNEHGVFRIVKKVF